MKLVKLLLALVALTAIIKPASSEPVTLSVMAVLSGIATIIGLAQNVYNGASWLFIDKSSIYGHNLSVLVSCVRTHFTVNVYYLIKLFPITDFASN